MRVYCAVMKWSCVFFFALAAWFGLANPATAASPQPLTIRVHGDGAQATQLSQYDPAAPIALSVQPVGNAKLDAVAIEATGPAGETVRAPLVRDPRGQYVGIVTLADEGVWDVRLTSRVGAISTTTTPVRLAVVAPPPSNAWQIGLAVGAAVFIVLGGSGFLLLRRTVGERAAQPQARAA